MEQTLSQIEGVTGSVEDNWGKMKGTLLDILNSDGNSTKKTMVNWCNDKENGEKKKSENHEHQKV